MIRYTVYPSTDYSIYVDACETVESLFQQAKKEHELIDVDGSRIQCYYIGESEIRVVMSYDYDEILIEDVHDILADHFLFLPVSLS